MIEKYTTPLFKVKFHRVLAALVTTTSTLSATIVMPDYGPVTGVKDWPAIGGNFYDSGVGGPGNADGSFTTEVSVTLPNLTSDWVLWEDGGEGTGTSLLVSGNSFALTVGGSADNFITGSFNSDLAGTDITFVSRFDNTTNIASVWINGEAVGSPSATGSVGSVDSWAGANRAGIGKSSDGQFRDTTAPDFNSFSENNLVGTSGDDITFSYWASALSDTDLVDSTAVVPEPSTYVLIAGLFAGLFAWHRRFRQQGLKLATYVHYIKIKGTPMQAKQPKVHPCASSGGRIPGAGFCEGAWGNPGELSI